MFNVHANILKIVHEKYDIMYLNKIERTRDSVCRRKKP